MNLTIIRKLRHLFIQEQIAETSDVVDPISSGMITMILSLEPFKDLAVVSLMIVLNTKITANGRECFCTVPFR